jgi:hypothetical protein
MAYVQLSSGENGILCPHSGGKSERHRRLVEIVDEVYDNLAAHRDAEGEWVSPEWETNYNEQIINLVKAEFPDLFISEHRQLEYMRLYHESASPWPGSHSIGRGGWVESWWWQCQGCHFVLPATRVQP